MSGSRERLFQAETTVITNALRREEACARNRSRPELLP